MTRFTNEKARPARSKNARAVFEKKPVVVERRIG
jgi:hypothetical protein